MVQEVLIVGYGDLARRVAPLCIQSGRRVRGLVRRSERVAELAAQGVAAVVGDLDDAGSLQGLEVEGCEVYYFAPPASVDATDPRMRHFLAAIAGQHPRRIVYISTTGVYGNSHGAWVDETAPTNPTTARGQRRLDAEGQLSRWGAATGVPVAVLRVGGVYGPGRLPLRQLESARPVVNAAESGFTNRIHADDLATVCTAAMARGEGVYNVSDGHPGSMAQYFTELAAALGYPIPQQVSLAEARRLLPPEMLSYLEESRRLDTTRLMQGLKVNLRYPDLASGIASIQQAQGVE